MKTFQMEHIFKEPFDYIIWILFLIITQTTIAISILIFEWINDNTISVIATQKRRYKYSRNTSVKLQFYQFVAFDKFLL